MSSNELNFDRSNQMLQSERNCINFDGSKRFNVNYKAMSHDDKCFIDIDTRQSIGPGNYSVTNLYDCECMMPQTVKNATDNVAVPLGQNGYGTEQACCIDTGSSIRWGQVKRFPKCKNQLFTRPYAGWFAGRGYLKPNEESELIFSEDTRVKRSSGLSGVTIPNYFTPLLPYLAYNVQNPVHIIEEVGSNGAMIHGAFPSRLLIRDLDLQQRCGANYQYAYMNKSTNPEFWANKGSLLQQ